MITKTTNPKTIIKQVSQNSSGVFREKNSTKPPSGGEFEHLEGAAAGVFAGLFALRRARRLVRAKMLRERCLC